MNKERDILLLRFCPLAVLIEYMHAAACVRSPARACMYMPA